MMRERQNQKHETVQNRIERTGEQILRAVGKRREDNKQDENRPNKWLFLRNIYSGKLFQEGIFLKCGKSTGDDVRESGKNGRRQKRKCKEAEYRIKISRTAF